MACLQDIYIRYPRRQSKELLLWLLFEGKWHIQIELIKARTRNRLKVCRFAYSTGFAYNKGIAAYSHLTSLLIYLASGF